MRITILPSAMNDLTGGEEFYEQQQEGLGAYFRDSLYSDIDSLKLYAGIHRQVYGCHRLLSKRFPYFIYYKVEGNTASVKAVLDCRRDPKWIKSKLGR